MAYKLGNRVKVSVSGTPGTGSITLGSALTGFVSFATAGIADTDTVPYVIEDGAAWEIGVGTYSSTGPTLARTTITASSNSNAAISATANAIVMLSPLAADLQSTDTLTSGTLPVARGGTGLNSLTTGRIPFGAGTSAFGSSANLTFNNSTNQFSVAGGSEATPAISTSGDTDTGIFFPAANMVSIGTFGTERIRVDGQKVGVAPSTLLGAGNGYAGNTAASSKGELDLYNGGTGATTLRNTGAFPIIFSTNNTERMRIDSAGNVGIGTSSPSGKLHVVGDTSRFTSANAFMPQITAHNQNNGTSGPYFIVQKGRAASGTSAAVQVGDALGTFIFKGIDTSGTEQNSAFLSTTVAAVGATSVDGAMEFLTYGSSSRIVFATNGSERARFDGSGNFGIGTGSPTTKLDVNADKFRVRTAKTPASATDTGNQGDVCWDTSYIYVCTATNTWKRAAIATW